MNCPRCQHDNLPTMKFCGECGARLAAVCPACGASNAGTQKFCGECGGPLTGTASAGKVASPESYTPKHLAEKILTSKAALEGERKQVTVLFADLKGSMELLADRDPEEARKILDPVLERMMEAVHRYEGTVNQVMGDGIMALFGAPLAHEDHAVRACYAALRMQESVTRHAEGVRREHGVTIRIRVGLNSGEVVVRAIGSDLHMDYTAVGQTTHLAARMEQLADPGATLLTAETLALAEGFVQVTSLGPMAVKGLTAPVEVYELTGVSAARSRLQAAATRGLSRFVGRDAEIEQLHRAVEHAQQGRGQVAAIVGGPGVGKSRLTLELIHSHHLEGWLTLQARALSYGKATSYLPVIDLLKNYFRIGDRESPHEIRDKVTARLLMLDRALEATLPALLALLDVSGDNAQWQALDPTQRRQRTLDAVKRLLLREAQVQPVLVVFEDLHWIDSETQALLDSLVESLPPARLLLFVNYRPEYEHHWGSKTSYAQLRLDPLPRESAFELLHGLLGEDRTIEPLTPILIERTEGNPFFLEETVRALVETKALVGERGAYRLAKVLTDIQVPPTVQAILAARIDRLSPQDKRLLQSAAVVGKDVPFALLAAIADEQEEEELRRGLAHLQAAEFLYEASFFQDLEYTFMHALTHEVAYGTLLQDRRKALHARIVGAIERIYPDRLIEHVERLAHHAVRAEAWERAIEFLRQAADRAAARSANREAIAHLRAALASLEHAPQTRHRTEQAIDLRLGISGACFPLREFDTIATVLAEAESLAGTLGDTRRMAQVAHSVATHGFLTGDLDRLMTSSEQAIRLASEARDVATLALGRDNLGRAYYLRGMYQRARDVLEQNVATITGDLQRQRFGQAGFVAVYSRHFLARTCAMIGAFAEAQVYAEQAHSIAIDHPHSSIAAANAAAHVALVRGEFGVAASLLERALALSESLDIRVWFPVLASSLGHAYAELGRIEQAVPLLEGAAAIGGEDEPRRMMQLAVGYLRAGRINDASSTVKRALAIAVDRRQEGAAADARRTLGEIMAAGGDPVDLASAEQEYKIALAHGESLGMRPLVAHCHLGLGKLFRRTSNSEQAREHLTTATTMYREMEMRFYLEQAEQELRELA